MQDDLTIGQLQGLIDTVLELEDQECLSKQHFAAFSSAYIARALKENEDNGLVDVRKLTKWLEKELILKKEQARVNFITEAEIKMKMKAA